MRSSAATLQADEVRRRREVRLVGDAAARVEADGARLEPGAQVGGEVAGRAVVAGDDDGRAPHVAVGDRRDQERAQRLRDERGSARLVELRGVRVVFEMAEERAERQTPAESTKARPSPGPIPGLERPRRACRTARAGPRRARRTTRPGPSRRARARARRRAWRCPGSVAGSSGIGPTPNACTNHAVSPTPAWTWKPVADALLGQQQRDVVGARGQPRAGQAARGEHRDQLEAAQQEVARRGRRPARWRSGPAASAGRRRARRRRSRRRSRRSARSPTSRRSARRPAGRPSAGWWRSRQGAAPSAGGLAAVGTVSSLRRRRRCHEAYVGSQRRG